MWNRGEVNHIRAVCSSYMWNNVIRAHFSLVSEYTFIHSLGLWNSCDVGVYFFGFWINFSFKLLFHRDNDCSLLCSRSKNELNFGLVINWIEIVYYYYQCAVIFMHFATNRNIVFHFLMNFFSNCFYFQCCFFLV